MRVTQVRFPNPGSFSDPPLSPTRFLFCSSLSCINKKSWKYDRMTLFWRPLRFFQPCCGSHRHLVNIISLCGLVFCFATYANRHANRPPCLVVARCHWRQTAGTNSSCNMMKYSVQHWFKKAACCKLGTENVNLSTHPQLVLWWIFHKFWGKTSHCGPHYCQCNTLPNYCRTLEMWKWAANQTGN